MTEQKHADELNLSPELFLEWRSPRLGEANPSRLDNPVWAWLVRNKLSAYQANKQFHGPSSFKAGPAWCFERFGQSETLMPDGRIIYIAGEHEDHYDPDFYIYNDVVVIRPDNVIEFYAYPKEIFPPTDFHTATIIGNKILIIGCLGYQDSRVYTETPVYILDTDTFVINKVITSGQSPRWIHRHTCELSGDERTIVLKKGLLDLGAERSLIENIDDWLLDIESWTWTRLTERKWPRWEVKRLDRKSNHLWEIGMALFDFEMGWSDKYAKSIENLSEALGKTVDINHIEMAKVLYTPDIPHTKLPEVEDEYNVHRLEIDGVIVRYVEDSRHIQVTVEGSLPENIIEQLKSDMLKKLAFLENFACDIGVI